MEVRQVQHEPRRRRGDGRPRRRCGGGRISSPLGRAGAPLAPRAYRCLAATPELDPGGEILAKPVGESC